MEFIPFFFKKNQSNFWNKHYQSYKNKIMNGLIVFIILFGSTPLLFADDAILSWDPSPDTDIVGYKLYYGTDSGQYTESIERREYDQLYPLGSYAGNVLLRRHRLRARPTRKQLLQRGLQRDERSPIRLAERRRGRRRGMRPAAPRARRRPSAGFGRNAGNRRDHLLSGRKEILPFFFQISASDITKESPASLLHLQDDLPIDRINSPLRP